MIACVDVGYQTKSALAACAVIADWPDCDPVTMHTVEIDQVEAYVPGEFYKRELPCILQVLSELTIRPTFIVVDGFVWLDANQKKGLGAHLYDELNQSVPIIGVAKTSFATAMMAVEIYRGGSTRPLWITSAGIAANDAANHIRSMHGEHRIPSILSLVDRLSKGIVKSSP